MSDTVKLLGATRVYQLRYDTNYPKDKTMGVVDLNNISPIDFHKCIWQCATPSPGNEGRVSAFTGCSGVSYVNSTCYLKYGLSEYSTPTTTFGALSAIIHFIPKSA